MRKYLDTILSRERIEQMVGYLEDNHFQVMYAAPPEKIAPADQKLWFHFGDLDPDGFLILKNLRHKTGLDFHPYHMEKELPEKYKDVTKPLEEHDRRKVENLMTSGFFTDTLEEILKSGRKLEQEAVTIPVSPQTAPIPQRHQ